MRSTLIVSTLAVFITHVAAYPFMGDYHKMTEAQKRDLTKLATRGIEARGAAAYSSQYPYTGAKNDGLPGSQIGNVQVPAPGDADHQYQDPPPGAYRGPCPGLNAAANHGFLSRDGIVTFNELVAAQQNVYNVGHDLAVVLATAGVGLDGDLVTLKLSLGGDATSKTSATPILGSQEGGLNTHNKFEADSSLTRNDYYLANGDNYSFNGTLFGYMNTACNGNFNRECLSKYRKDRYYQSRADNGQFNFQPTALLLYGAASFLYELMPTNGGQPDLATISTFFGAKPDGNGGWTHVPERIPDNWFNRLTPYTGIDVTREILAMYLENPVPFGGNLGKGNFVGTDLGTTVVKGKYTPASAKDLGCFLQQVLLAPIPSTVQNLVLTPIAALRFIAGKVNPIFAQDFGCPAVNI